MHPKHIPNITPIVSVDEEELEFLIVGVEVGGLGLGLIRLGVGFFVGMSVELKVGVKLEMNTNFSVLSQLINLSKDIMLSEDE